MEMFSSKISLSPPLSMLIYIFNYLPIFYLECIEPDAPANTAIS